MPDVSLAAKMVGAQGSKEMENEEKGLADNVFKMAECLMADHYAVFKKGA